VHLIKDVKGADEVEGDILDFCVGDGAYHIKSVNPQFLILGDNCINDAPDEFVEAEDRFVHRNVVVLQHLGQIFNGIGHVLVAKSVTCGEGCDYRDHLVDLC